MNEELRQQRIEDYLAGKLTREESSAFEAEMATDSSLQEHVELYQHAEAAIQYMKYKELKSRLKSIDSELDSNVNRPVARQSIITPMYRRIAVAASVILVVGIGATIFLRNQTLTGPDLAQRYFASIEVDQLRSQDETKPADWVSQLILAEESFKSGNYTTAADIYLKLEDENLIHQEKIQWNLLMSYIGAGNTTKANNLLDVILSDSEHGFYDKAVKVRKAIQ